MICLKKKAKKEFKDWAKALLDFSKWFLDFFYFILVFVFVLMYTFHSLGGFQKEIEEQAIYYLGIISLPKFALVIYSFLKYVYNSFEKC